MSYSGSYSVEVNFGSSCDIVRVIPIEDTNTYMVVQAPVTSVVSCLSYRPRSCTCTSDLENVRCVTICFPENRNSQISRKFFKSFFNKTFFARSFNYIVIAFSKFIFGYIL